MPRRPSESQDKFIIRLPDGMRDQIKAAADTNARTMTAEVVHRLVQSFGQEQQQPSGLKSIVAGAKAQSAKARATNADLEPLQEIMMRLDAIERRLDMRDGKV